jgi:hypothetical protein
MSASFWTRPRARLTPANFQRDVIGCVVEVRKRLRWLPGAVVFRTLRGPVPSLL